MRIVHAAHTYQCHRGDESTITAVLCILCMMASQRAANIMSMVNGIYDIRINAAQSISNDST
jgi:hypothetical protein